MPKLLKSNLKRRRSKLCLPLKKYLKIPLAIYFFETYFGSKFGFLTNMKICKFEWIVKIIQNNDMIIKMKLYKLQRMANNTTN